jgi:hypothetical protein
MQTFPDAGKSVPAITIDIIALFDYSLHIANVLECNLALMLRMACTVESESSSMNIRLSPKEIC